MKRTVNILIWALATLFAVSCSLHEDTSNVANPKDFYKNEAQITSSNIVLGNELAMYFYVQNADLTGTDYIAVVTKTYADGRDDVVVEIPYTAWEPASNNRMRFKFDGIAAKEMGDDRYYCAYAKLTDGSYIYAPLYRYSPKQYAWSRLEKSTDENVKALCVALLNYGTAAQRYFDYKTGDACPNFDSITVAKPTYFSANPKAANVTDFAIGNSNVAFGIGCKNGECCGVFKADVVNYIVFGTAHKEKINGGHNFDIVVNFARLTLVAIKVENLVFKVVVVVAVVGHSVDTLPLLNACNHTVIEYTSAGIGIIESNLPNVRLNFNPTVVFGIIFGRAENLRLHTFAVRTVGNTVCGIKCATKTENAATFEKYSVTFL